MFIIMTRLGPNAAVLLHAKAADGRHGQPEGAERVSDMRQDAVRQVNLEQAHADTHRYTDELYFLFYCKVSKVSKTSALGKRVSVWVYLEKSRFLRKLP
jgi:hypothetical protein